jgi:hypothetical protein
MVHLSLRCIFDLFLLCSMLLQKSDYPIESGKYITGLKVDGFRTDIKMKLLVISPN